MSETAPARRYFKGRRVKTRGPGEYFPFHSARERNLWKRQAASLVSLALSEGTLTRGACERCGAEKSEAHHRDYRKPLEVEWLCRPCHRQRHLEMGAVGELPVPDTDGDAPPAKFSALVEHPATRALVVHATDVVLTAMRSHDLSENQLAARIAVSRQMVNVTFAGGIRTLKTLAVLADALNCDVVVELRPRISPVEQALSEQAVHP